MAFAAGASERVARMVAGQSVAIPCGVLVSRRAGGFLTPRSAQAWGMLGCHEPVDAEEACHLQTLRDVLKNYAEPFARDHYQPGHFTASAFVLDPDEQAVLLIYHGKLKRWLQPGGHVEERDRDLFVNSFVML